MVNIGWHRELAVVSLFSLIRVANGIKLQYRRAFTVFPLRSFFSSSIILRETSVVMLISLYSYSTNWYVFVLEWKFVLRSILLDLLCNPQHMVLLDVDKVRYLLHLLYEVYIRHCLIALIILMSCDLILTNSWLFLNTVIVPYWLMITTSDLEVVLLLRNIGCRCTRQTG